MSPRSWSLECGGTVVTVRAHGEQDELVFSWNQETVPARHRVQIRRALDGTAVPMVLRPLAGDPDGVECWGVDPGFVLDAVGEFVRRFVNQLTAEELRGICRAEALARLHHLETLAESSGSGLGPRGEAAVLVSARLEAAVLSIHDSATRDAALRLLPSWTGQATDTILKRGGLGCASGSALQN